MIIKINSELNTIIYYFNPYLKKFIADLVQFY